MRHARKLDGLFLVALGALQLVAPHVGRSLAPPAAAHERAPWNFLIIVIDTLRYDVTSMAGPPNTPFMQRVAQRGVSFSRAFSTHDATPASHFTLFTGLREGGGTANDRADMSLAYQFRERGYSTFAVAANGNLSQKWMQSLAGFTRYSSPYDDWIAMAPHDRERHLPAINARLRRYGARENEWNQAQLFCTGAEVMSRLRGMLATSSEPFFGFVNIIEPHDPYLPSAAALGREPASAQDVDADLRFRTLVFPLADPHRLANPSVRASIVNRLAAIGGRTWSLSDDLPESNLAAYKRRYTASVRDADQIVRSIFLALEENRTRERTWVVLVSDHGESFGEAGYLTHSLADRGDFEATHHVPMVWAPPGTLSNGATIDDDVSLADVAPTIYDLAGIDWTPLKGQTSGEFGRSLVRYLPVDPTDATVQAKLGSVVPDAERKRMRDEAAQRLRALGYIQ